MGLLRARLGGNLFIHVNCYFLPKLLAVQMMISPLWYPKIREPGKPEVDRVISRTLGRLRRPTTAPTPTP